MNTYISVYKYLYYNFFMFRENYNSSYFNYDGNNYLKKKFFNVGEGRRFDPGLRVSSSCHSAHSLSMFEIILLLWFTIQLVIHIKPSLSIITSPEHVDREYSLIYNDEIG